MVGVTSSNLVGRTILLPPLLTTCSKESIHYNQNMKIILLFLGFIMTLPTFASQKETPGAWFGLFHKKNIGKELSMWGDFQLRYTMEEGGMQQTLFRFGPLWKLSKDHEIGLLYGFVESSVKEYRTTLHHTYSVSPHFSLRSRLEYRNLEDNDDDSLRFRYLVRYLHGLKGSNSLLIWDEPFLNLTSDKWTGERSFDRNRFFIGLRFPVLGMDVEAGYLNQFIPRSNRDTMEHLALLYVYY
jgi:hypothetical protein